MIDLITGFGVDVVYIDRMSEKLADRILGDEEKKLIPDSRKKELSLIHISEPTRPY